MCADSAHMDSAWRLAANLIVADTDDPHPDFMPIFDGRTGAFTGVATSHDGSRKVFIKWADSDSQFAYGCLYREVLAHSWLTPNITNGITVIDHQQDEGGLAAAFTYFEGKDISKWSDETIQSALDSLFSTHDELARLDAPIDLPDLDSRTASLIPNRYDAHLDAFRALAFSEAYIADICHGDIHRKNFLTSDNQTALIDWSWVTRMPRSYDIAMLAVDAALDGYDPIEILAVAGEYAHASAALGAYGAFLMSANVESTAHQMHPHEARVEIIDSALSRLPLAT